MGETKRSTVYFEPKVYRALKIKAATTDRGLSDLVNEAVRLALRDDAVDLALARRRLRQPSRSFEDVWADLKCKARL